MANWVIAQISLPSLWSITAHSVHMKPEMCMRKGVQWARKKREPLSRLCREVEYVCMLDRYYPRCRASERARRRWPACRRWPVGRPAKPWPTRRASWSWARGRWAHAPCWCSRCRHASPSPPPPDRQPATACAHDPPTYANRHRRVGFPLSRTRSRPISFPSFGLLLHYFFSSFLSNVQLRDLESAAVIFPASSPVELRPPMHFCILNLKITAGDKDFLSLPGHIKMLIVTEFSSCQNFIGSTRPNGMDPTDFKVIGIMHILLCDYQIPCRRYSTKMFAVIY